MGINPLNPLLLSEINNLDATAVLPREKEQADGLRKQWNAQCENEQRKRDGEALKELTAIDAQVGALENARRDEASENRLHQVRLELWKLQERADISKEPRQKVASVQERLESVQKRWASDEKRARLRQNVTDGLGSIERFRQALEELKKEVDPDPQAQGELDQAEQESPLWAGVEAWNKLTALLRDRKLMELTPDAARECVTQAKSVLEKYGDFPPPPPSATPCPTWRPLPAA